MERKRDESTTLCITVMVPNDRNADISVTLCAGQDAVAPLIEAFNLLPTWSSLPTHE
jgi:hypothetical protein